MTVLGRYIRAYIRSCCKQVAVFNRRMLLGVRIHYEGRCLKATLSTNPLCMNFLISTAPSFSDDPDIRMHNIN